VTLLLLLRIWQFIGTSQANHRADEACALGIRDLWTPENHYRWTASRYGGHISASVNSIRDSRLFSKNVDARQKNELEQQKAEVDGVITQTEHEIKALNNELRALEDNAAKLHKQREEFINRVKLEKKKRTDLSFRVGQHLY
jgi:predicted nucleotide-binding protein (sugar kinase/HSP70/actin superfamily)